MKYLGCDRRARERFRENPNSITNPGPGAMFQIRGSGHSSLNMLLAAEFSVHFDLIYEYICDTRGAGAVYVMDDKKKVIDKRGIGSVTSIIRCHMIIIIVYLFCSYLH